MASQWRKGPHDLSRCIFIRLQCTTQDAVYMYYVMRGVGRERRPKSHKRASDSSCIGKSKVCRILAYRLTEVSLARDAVDFFSNARKNLQRLFPRERESRG